MTNIRIKCWAFLTVVLISCSFAFSGVYTFTDADSANSNWSNPANWDGGVLPVFDATCIVTQESATASIDTNITIFTLVVSDDIETDVVLSGTNELTFMHADSGFYSIENYCNGTLYLQGLYVFENSIKTWNYSYIKNQKWHSNLTFDTNSVTYFNCHTQISGNQIKFLGEIKYNTPRLKLSSSVIFGESSINNCNMPIELNGANVTVNTTNLMSSGSIVSTWTSTLTINTDDTLGGTPDLDTDAITTLNINGNVDFGTLDLSSGGTRIMTINLDADVDYLTFEDSSSYDWGDEQLQINDFRSGVIRFGTDKNGLTDTQLGKIIADGAGEKGVELDSNGWLIPVQSAGTVILIK